jgi:hypothetical protein
LCQQYLNRPEYRTYLYIELTFVTLNRGVFKEGKKGIGTIFALKKRNCSEGFKEEKGHVNEFRF